MSLAEPSGRARADALEALTRRAIDATWTADVLRRALDAARGGEDPLGAVVEAARAVGGHPAWGAHGAPGGRGGAVLAALCAAWGPPQGGDAVALAWLLAPKDGRPPPLTPARDVEGGAAAPVLSACADLRTPGERGSACGWGKSGSLAARVHARAAHAIRVSGGGEAGA